MLQLFFMFKLATWFKITYSYFKPRSLFCQLLWQIIFAISHIIICRKCQILWQIFLKLFAKVFANFREKIYTLYMLIFKEINNMEIFLIPMALLILAIGFMINGGR